MDEMKQTTKDIISSKVLLDDVKKQIKSSNGNISKPEIKTIVNFYYEVQDKRKALTEQIRAIEKAKDESDEPIVNASVLKWILKNITDLEKEIKNILELICESDEVGRWLLSIVGIGPVLAAGLISYFDIEGKEYATQFINYSGLNDNNRPWIGKQKATEIINEIISEDEEITDDDVATIAAKTQWKYSYLLEKAYDDKNGWDKQKLIKAVSAIPYNRELKTLMYKVGESFHWQCNNPKSLYGKMFSERKALEIARNEAGEYAEQAANILKEKKFAKDTAAYKSLSQGKLSMAHINARCIRWVEKLFISHLFEEMYRVRYDKKPPRFYTLVHCNEQHNKDIQPEVQYTLISEEKL